MFATSFLSIQGNHLQKHYIALSTILFILTPATVIFNLLTILTFLRKIKFRIPSNILLCAVAVTDLITGLTATPIMGVLHLCRYLKLVSCPLYLPGVIVTFSVTFTTFVTMLLISIDKYIAIFHPFTYNARIGNNVLITAVGIMWTLVLLCSAFSIFTSELKLVRNAVITVACSLLPFAIFVYTRIFFELRRRGRQIHTRRLSLNQAKVINEICRDARRVSQGLRATSTIIVVLCICYPPVATVVIMRRFGHADFHSDIHSLLQAWLNVLLLSTSLMNPFIYCWQLKGFRRDLFDLLRQRTSLRSLETQLT